MSVFIRNLQTFIKLRARGRRQIKILDKTVGLIRKWIFVEAVFMEEPKGLYKPPEPVRKSLY